MRISRHAEPYSSGKWLASASNLKLLLIEAQLFLCLKKINCAVAEFIKSPNYGNLLVFERLLNNLVLLEIVYLLSNIGNHSFKASVLYSREFSVGCLRLGQCDRGVVGHSEVQHDVSPHLALLLSPRYNLHDPLLLPHGILNA